MLAKIQSTRIHRYIQQVVDAEGKVTEKDVIQLDVHFPEYLELPTYGLTVDFPATKENVMAAVQKLAVQVNAQMTKDAAVRKQLEEVFEFDVEV
jgi:hypothetical protein